MATLNRRRPQATMTGGDSLADILERVLDKGIVIAGDIRVQLADIELLTIQIRLVVCSVERAQEMGMTWWQDTPFISSQTDQVEDRSQQSSEQGLEAVNQRLQRLEAMHEQLLYRLEQPGKRDDN